MIVIVCAVLQASISGRSRVNNLMALVFFLMGLFLFYFWSYRTGFIFRVPWLIYGDLVLTCMIGPAGYFYARSLAGEDVELKGPRLLHFLPAALAVAFVVTYHAVIGFDRLNRLGHWPNYYRYPAVYAASILADIVLYVYIFLSLGKMYRLVRTERFKSVREIRTVFYFFTTMMASTSVLFVAHYLRNNLLAAAVAIVNGGLSVYYLFFSYRHPEFTQRVIREPRGGRNAETLPEGFDIAGSIGRLMELVENEKVYRDPAITLQTLSNALEINSHHLSIILNEKLLVNFRSFINRYRLQEAMRLLAEAPEKTVLEIAFAVGFNSKSVFNDLFARETGLTPTRYREKTKK
ncbi:MAG: AraC family transcriptional regulator [Spirochaetes bacterium]|nr:AraC family transcriptional regulator [Spirochaetota bacterium]